MLRKKFALTCCFVVVTAVIVICVILLLSLINPTSEPKKEHDGDPIIQTAQGKIMGTYQKSYGGRTVSAFEGIPYAIPPVGDLRFEQARGLAPPWNGTLIANTTYICTQLPITEDTANFKGGEDCLYINVYVPKIHITGKENMNVVVSVHGGGFMFGDAYTTEIGPSYIMDKDLVYATFSYRLGVLGFLSTSDEVVPGNNGFKDQVMALKWIKYNIKYFGGNPRSVTLAGLSGGATAVHYHYVSPLSKGLFHRGLSQSGVALNQWAFTLQPLALERTKTFALNLSCTHNSTKGMVNCLKSKSLVELMEAFHKFFQFNNVLPATPFGPVIEKGKSAFLLDHPYKLLSEGRVNPVLWVTSNTAHEATISASGIPFEVIQNVVQNWQSGFPVFMNYNSTVDDVDKEFVSASLLNFYLHNRSLADGGLQGFVDMYSDRWFMLDSELSLRLHSKAMESKVYYYIFNYILEHRNVTPILQIGAGHTEDAKLLFRRFNETHVLSDSDNQMKNLFIDFLYDYASTGVPTFGKVKWATVTSSKLINYLYIGSPNDIRMRTIDELAPTAFWETLPFKENQKLFKKP